MSSESKDIWYRLICTIFLKIPILTLTQASSKADYMSYLVNINPNRLIAINSSSSNFVGLKG